MELAPAVCTVYVVSDPSSFTIEPTTLLIGQGDSFDLPASGMFRLSEGSYARYSYKLKISMSIIKKTAA